MPDKKECIYNVSGMHCASCEILIEKKLLDITNIKSVNASGAKGEVVIEYEENEPSINRLNNLFAKDNYTFSRKIENNSYVIELDGILKSLGIAIAIIFSFFALNNLGLGKYANVNAASSLPSFFVLGLIAGASTCAALVGGIVLSMSKQWADLYAQENSTKKKMQPHLMFNFGRILSYALFGIILGALGAKLHLSIKFSALLVIAISILMILLALQMLGIRAFRKLHLGAPKFITRHIANEKNFNGKYMPAVMGALTVFLPCGFTITVQSIALLSGTAIQGGLIMLLFALGTAPALLAIGLSSVKLACRPHWAGQFAKVAGIIIIFFALYNINAQSTVLDWKLPVNLFTQSNAKNQDNGLPAIVDGRQILKMEASARGYKPNYLKVKANIPVRWEIKDTGTSGCTNAIISKLFDGQIDLTPGKTSVKEFTPETPGIYRFSCWMGMVRGTIEVVQ